MRNFWRLSSIYLKSSWARYGGELGALLICSFSSKFSIVLLKNLSIKSLSYLPAYWEHSENPRPVKCVMSVVCIAGNITWKCSQQTFEPVWEQFLCMILTCYKKKNFSNFALRVEDRRVTTEWSIPLFCFASWNITEIVDFALWKPPWEVELLPRQAQLSVWGRDGKDAAHWSTSDPLCLSVLSSLIRQRV